MCLCISLPKRRETGYSPSLQDNIPFMMTAKLPGYLELIETSLKNFPQSALILGSFSEFWTSI